MTILLVIAVLLNGPFEFRRIEWLLLPHRVEFKPCENAPTQYKMQDLTPTLEYLSMFGCFEVEMDKVGLRIFGYKLEQTVLE
ncbi:hypothetical protein [Pseudoalteromonas sp. Of7M-16]|uniref:hypothetical protein n=1 Tax=Pseudoalteromonas sp. Of7M-16 TaxID=2917756 RepID=UPI001EF5A759|nr:hypothetical protein [Pseudoalteromonas sp. Of7M-16]MCG7549250.1 hypothetical protein [Pseudoalteromonas sp. Of7M-16]